jgi:hypothetical protein
MSQSLQFFHFGLMPYPNIPPPEQIESTWVNLSNSNYDPVVGHRLYNEYLDQAVLAEKLGYDGTCVNEHHQNAYGLMPSPNLMASILSRITTQAKIVVMGNSVALYNPPTRVAEEMAMLDVLSGGRLVAGFPVGTAMDSIFTYGVPPAILRDKYYEAVGLILGAWEDPEPFAFNGRYTQLRYVNVWPRPVSDTPAASVDPRWGQRRDVAVVCRERLSLRLPVLLRQAGGGADDAGVLGYCRAPRRGPQPIPGRLPAVRGRRR